MLAPSKLPNEYCAWNRECKAPFGPRLWSRFLEGKYYGRFGWRWSPGRVAWTNRMKFSRWVMRRLGPFAFQSNSGTRTFEYPWAFHATTLSAGMRAVEIGGGASGFQFILAERGLDVESVDPVVNPGKAVDWVFSWDDFERLNRAFGGRVKLIRDYIERAHLQSDAYERVFAISVIEHIPEAGVYSIMREVRRILKPGGYFIATIDLFLDCYPFTDRRASQFGQNISVRNLVKESGLELRRGTPCELWGYPQFDTERIIMNRRQFLAVNNVMTQCLVLQKASG